MGGCFVRSNMAVYDLDVFKGGGIMRWWLYGLIAGCGLFSPHQTNGLLALIAFSVVYYGSRMVKK